MGDSYPKLRVAAVEAAPVLLDREATVNKACGLILEAGALGADLVVFPECFIPGYPGWLGFYPPRHPLCQRLNRELFKNAVEVPSPATDLLCQAARQANTYVVMGFNERRPGMMGTLYNSQLFIHRSGQLLGKRQKLMPTSIERLVHGMGDGRGLRVFPTEYGALGGLICAENGNPLYRFALAAQGEVLHAAGWPSFSTAGNLREVMLVRMRNYAAESVVFVVSSAITFTEEMAKVMELHEAAHRSFPETGGVTAILGPNGELRAGPAESGEAILTADIDLEELIDFRMVHDYTGHYNRFDVVSLNFNPSPFTPLHTPPATASLPNEEVDRARLSDSRSQGEGD